MLLRKNLQAFFSLLISIICASVFYRIDGCSSLRPSSNFKIYYHNINSSNSSLSDLSSIIKKSDAEIVTLVESTTESEKIIFHDLNNYTHRFSIARRDNFGFLILSKVNFNLEEVHEHIGISVYIKFFVKKYDLKIYLLHLPPPLWREAWETQNEALSLIANEITKNKKQSFLILGDFNMTNSSSQFQDFYRQLNLKLYTQELFTQGTWPSFIPKYLSLPIDHVLSNRNFEMKIGPSVGSDHRSIIVNISPFSN